MSSEEWNTKHKVKFEEITGMNADEWLLNKYKTISPFELIKAYGVATKDEETLVRELNTIGLSNEVINALLEYLFVFNGKEFDHTLVLEVANNWIENDIKTIDKAIEFMKEKT